MNHVQRDRAIFHIENATPCFCALSKNPCEEIKISQKELAQIVFANNKFRASETEAAAIISSPFRLSELVDEAKNASESMLLKNGNQIRVKLEKLPEWKSLSLLGGQDLYILACYPGSYLHWPSPISAYDKGLEANLSGGIAENHCHFSALGPIFELNWMHLHNGPTPLSPLKQIKKAKTKIQEYYRESDYHLLYNAAMIEIYLRRFLYHSYAKPINFASFSIATIDELKFQRNDVELRLQSELALLPCRFPEQSGRCVDYALRGATDDPIFGERYFLKNCLEKYQKWGNVEKTAFYLYLILKRFIASFFTLNNDQYGFTNFERFERMSSIFLPKGSGVELEKAVYAFNAIQEEKAIKKCELRIAPKSYHNEMLRKLKLIQDTKALVKPNAEIGVVYHYIKKTQELFRSLPNPISNLDYRASNLCKEYDDQTSAIIRIIDSQSAGQNVVGIDAANEEYRCRPEIFAPFYRRIRQHYEKLPAQKRPLHFTFHVGEDFPTLANGLRAIYETVTFLELDSEDRIGHASALGVNPDQYFLLKGRHIYQTKQDFLDDYCFLYKMCIKSRRKRILSILRGQAIRLLNEIYGSSDLDGYLLSLNLRGDHPNIYKCVRSAGEFEPALKQAVSMGRGYYISQSVESKQSWNSDAALRFIHNYHFSEEARKKGDSIAMENLTKEYKEAIGIAIQEIYDLMVGKGIAIETNPTSNYLIGPFAEFEHIPTLAFLGIGNGPLAKRSNKIDLSIGTDDPGIVSTTLTNEYASIYYALKEINPKGDPGPTIKHLAETSIKRSFV